LPFCGMLSSGFPFLLTIDPEYLAGTINCISRIVGPSGDCVMFSRTRSVVWGVDCF